MAGKSRFGGAAIRNSLGDGSPLCTLHGEVALPIGPDSTIDIAGERRVAKVGEKLGFAEKTLYCACITREATTQHLDGDRGSFARPASEEDSRRSALANAGTHRK